MPTRHLPSPPSLAHLKSQARDLMRDRQSRSLQALQRIREFHPRFDGADDDPITDAEFRLSDAQLTIAREYGFASWPRLKAFVENPHGDDVAKPVHLRIADPLFRRAVDLMDSGDAEALHTLLREHPDLATARVSFEGLNYFRNPTLLEFIAENPTRNGRLQQNAAGMANIVIAAGAKNDRKALDEALALVASSAVARESGVQRELIDVLCEAGADPNSATYAPLLYGEFDAVEALIGHGARIDLIVAAGTGRLRQAKDALMLADDATRRKALALAAQHGHRAIVELLVEAGTDIDRFTPGGHSHATPLHQAALAGHLEIVRYLVEHGARTDIADVLHGGTPLDWARHAGHDDVIEYLAAFERTSPI
jgi:ankyrin repeat protein